MHIYLISGSVLLSGILIALVLYFVKISNDRKIEQLKSDKTKLEAALEIIKLEQDKKEERLSKIQEENLKLNRENSSLKSDYTNLQEKLLTQKKELEELQKKFQDAFENLANRIFEEKTSKFTEKNKLNLEEILTPLKEKIREFEAKVEDTHKKNLVSNSALIEQIKSLEKLNKQISDDAENLTKALKGDVKVQGNWGEVILKRLLEESGLREGIEYYSQGKNLNLKSEQGLPSRPDIVVKLPDNKHIIIDSKVSLVAYERLIRVEDEESKERLRKELERSIKSHIDNLHKKHYQQLEGLNTPDFVFLFMPIEASFTIALHPDSSLFRDALEKNIIIVGPSGLLATLRTIESIWKQENQTKNALEIARQSGNLYDAFSRLLEDIEKIGVNIKRADDSYRSALKRIKTGRGNLVSRVENLKRLGAKTSKEIPEKFKGDDLDLIEE